MRIAILLALVITALPALAGRSSSVLQFNGVSLGDHAELIDEAGRRGLCAGAKDVITECIIHDDYGIEYSIYDGRVVRIEVKQPVPEVVLPYKLRLGIEINEALRRSFSAEGERALVKTNLGRTIVIKMVREPKTDYEFEFQMHFDENGVLQRIIYKDVI